MKRFDHELGATVTIAASGEQGEIIARADYATSEDMYRIRYCAVDGHAVEAWWDASALTAA